MDGRDHRPAMTVNMIDPFVKRRIKPLGCPAGLPQRNSPRGEDNPGRSRSNPALVQLKAAA
jgi:hypothetical protein